MCIEAIAWAFKQSIKPAALKFVLVAMADCANEREGMRCWPSTKHICAVTGLDRKTVINYMDELQTLGYIQDTGEKCGRTLQVKVFIFNMIGKHPENGTVTIEPSPDLSTQSTKGAGNGTLKGSRFSLKASRFSLKGSQKRDTEPLVTLSNQLASKFNGNGKENPPHSGEPVLFSKTQIGAARPGDPAYDPEINDTEMLPGGWQALGQARGIDAEVIHSSWKKLLAAVSGERLRRSRWAKWIEGER